MVGASADNAHADAVLLVPAGISIDDIDAISGVEVVDGTLAVDFPDLTNHVVSIHVPRKSNADC